MTAATLTTTAGMTRRLLALTKPRIIELLLITTVPAMVIAEGGWPSTWLVVATLIGGTLSAAGANVLNNVLDRDIDRLMRRTAWRPTACGEVAPGVALAFGVLLGVAGGVWLAVLVHPTAALLATGALLFYVFVYTLGLKRRTPQAVVIGGAAGCVPVLTGWAAVTGGDLTDPRPWLLFAIVFYWTPPHFWALALRYQDDYVAAGLPMLPVTHGVAETTRHILLYSYLLAAVQLMYWAGARAGLWYVVPMAAATAVWLVLAHRLRAEPSLDRAMRLFRWSTTHLAVVFVAALLDAIL